MAQHQTTIAFVSGRGAGSKRSSHYDGLIALLPEGVRLEVEGLSLWHESHRPQPEIVQEYVQTALDLVANNKWDGVALPVAPNELLYPEAIQQIREAVRIPMTTALEASVAALQALSMRRPLLLTPFDLPLNERLASFLKRHGIEPALPSRFFNSVEDAAAASPDEVFELAQRELGEAKTVDGIYFQGGRLDPLLVLERMESELKTTVIASNTAMLWHILCKLKQTH
ncbi:MAG: hypothetical protein GTO40_27625, partial [Deltaproteobacteria bacterium]|nr:hypothetical protein [Deltaproteobacteria bacterium]